MKIRVAGSAPSGANMQPWHFVLISDPAIKKQIRIAAEKDTKVPNIKRKLLRTILTEF